ncbi:MAG: hypothetical protein GKR85_09985 [Candidatus Nanopelagicales bacterium]|nr:hypothetical protein [Candidatus Nanopelagicales bacterium]
MTVPALFIGVVSYPGTRYVQAQGSDGLAARLAAALKDRGRQCAVVVDTLNRLDTEQAPVTDEDVQASLSAQMRLASDWEQYLRTTQSFSVRSGAQSMLRWVRRGWQRVAPPRESMVERLLNIELAHQDLLRQGVASQAPWILIIEDDASSTNIEDLANGIATLLEQAKPTVQFINLSESFGVSELGIDHLLRDSEYSWHGSVRRTVLTAQKPVTNTVCAIAYRSSFAGHLLSTYASMPLRPVVPIDWKLNQALMSMHAAGSLAADSCWWVVPGPIDQLSMRGDS